ncbi:unnamed protein product [Rangifer tarandus platyrhynchus]|uniref:Uncharacterized protein n=1 Tax=Rangifer tarandus platyrhynchus TaxID=3082113 RepID=A0AC60A3C1_RANTA
MPLMPGLAPGHKPSPWWALPGGVSWAGLLAAAPTKSIGRSPGLRGVSSPSWSRPVTLRWVRQYHKHRTGWLEWLGPEPLPCVPCLPREFLPPEVLAGAQLWIASMLPAFWLSSLGEVPEAVAAGTFSPPPRAELLEDLGIEYALSRKGRVSGAGRAVLESGAGRGTYLNGV